MEQNLYCVKQDAEVREDENNAVRNFSKATETACVLKWTENLPDG